MRTELQLVQFSHIWDYKFWEPEKHRMYFVGSTNVREEFEITFEDDEGEEVNDLVQKRCLAVYATYQDYLAGDEVCYVPKEDSDYIITTLMISVDEDHNILGIAEPMPKGEL